MPIHKSVDKNFFKKWSPEMAYVLGFFAADGNMIRNKRGAYFISIEICDVSIIRKIRTLLKSSHKIGIRKSRSVKESDKYRLQIGSKEMYADLCTIGFTSNKTHNMTVPFVPKKLFRHFVRGYFDGDGNVWLGMTHKKRKTTYVALASAFTSSSLHFLSELEKRLLVLNIKGSVQKRDTYFRLVYGVVASLKLYDLMYEGYNGSLFLERKKSVFDKYIRLKMRP